MFSEWFVILSNLAFIFPVYTVLLWEKGQCTKAIITLILSQTGIISLVYHGEFTGIFIGTSQQRSFWQSMDFFYSFMSLILIALYVFLSLEYAYVWVYVLFIIPWVYFISQGFFSFFVALSLLVALLLGGIVLGSITQIRHNRLRSPCSTKRHEEIISFPWRWSFYSWTLYSFVLGLIAVEIVLNRAGYIEGSPYNLVHGLHHILIFIIAALVIIEKSVLRYKDPNLYTIKRQFVKTNK